LKIKRVKKELFRKYRRLAKWLNIEYKVKLDISFDKVIKLCALAIPIYSVSYLNAFYGQFGIKYFIYFNALDFVRIIYEINYPIISAIVISSFLFLLAGIASYQQNGKSYWNKSVLVIIISAIIMLALYWESYILNNFRSSILACMIIGLIGIAVSVIHLKSSRMLFYTLLYVLLFSSFIKANYNAIIIENSKPKFDIVLKDNRKVLGEKFKDGSYYIGNTTSYIFIYDGRLNRIRAIDRAEIKEFRFKKKLTK